MSLTRKALSRGFIALLALSLAVTASAKVPSAKQSQAKQEKPSKIIQKLPILGRKKVKFLDEFYQWFNIVGENKYTIDFAMLSRYFTPDAEFYHNGTKIAGSHKVMYSRLLLAQKFFKLVKAEFPFDDVIVSGDKIIARYKLDFQKRKSAVERHQAISIFQFKNGKIYRWWEVEKKIRRFG